MTQEESRTNRLTLAIGLAIPVLMMIMVASAIYLPRWFGDVEPARFDFVYAMGRHDPYVHYLVREQRLIREEREIPETINRVPDDTYFFVHDVTINKSTEITFEQAGKLLLDAAVIAEDGYQVKMGRRAGWFPFDSHYDYRRRFLVNDHFSQELNLQLERSGSYHSSSFRFLGWVIHD